MILFEVHGDGTVTSTPSLIPQGTSLADIVVVTDADYSLVTLRLVPPSGKHIEDIICTPTKTAGRTLWQALLPAEACRMSGRLIYQIVITMKDGRTITTPEGKITVQPGVISNMPDTAQELGNYSIDAIYTLLANIYANDEALSEAVAKIQPKLSNLLEIATTTISAGAWTDNTPFTTTIGSASYKKGDVIMLLPANDETRDAAGRARLSVTTELTPSESGGYTYIVARAEGKEAPGIDMEFIRIILNDETDHEPRISLVGIDTTAADIDEAVEQAKKDIENTVKVETVSVTWGSNYSQSISLKGISDPDNVFFLIPSDTTTRDVITRAGMTVSTTATYAPMYSVFFTTATVKNIAPIKGKTLNFTVLHVREPGATERRTVLVGVDSSDDIPTSIDLSRLDEGIINETFGGSSASKTTTIEYDEDGNPVKITDYDGNETVITW